jgi:hypothetical protein
MAMLSELAMHHPISRVFQGWKMTVVSFILLSGFTAILANQC